MHTAPPNKMVKVDRWPRAKPAHDAYERACERAAELEARDRFDSPAVLAARQAVLDADKAYKAAVHADERERLNAAAVPEIRFQGVASPRVKCACGSWLDPETEGRCPDCHRRLPAVVRR